METKKKLPLPIIIIIVGIGIGLLVSIIGLYKQLDAKKVNKEREENALKISQEEVDRANKRLEEIEIEYNTLKEKYDNNKKECDSLSMGEPNWFNNQSKCQSEEVELKNKMNKLEMEDRELKTKDYTVYYQTVNPMTYQIFYIIGASVAGISLLGAFIIYLVKGKKSY